MERDRNRQEEPAPKYTCCLGTLYYSQSRLDKGKPPVSIFGLQDFHVPNAGFLSALRTSPELIKLSWCRKRALLAGFAPRSGRQWQAAAAEQRCPPHSSSRPQLCGGISRRLKQADGPVQLPADTVPGGEFK